MKHKISTLVYEFLSAEERTTLQFAASARGDDRELTRLLTTAPTLSSRCPHNFITVIGRAFLALLYRVQQLESIGGFLLASTQMGNESGDSSDAGSVDTWAAVAAGCAHRYAQNAEAWAKFCAERGIEPNDLLDEVPGDRLVELADERIPHLTQQEVADALGMDVERVTLTAESLLKEWRELYDQLGGSPYWSFN